MNTDYTNLNKKNISTIFMGTPGFATPVLEYILNDERLNLKAVVTQPDKAAGRKKIITPPPVKVYSRKMDLTVLQPEKIRDANFIKQLEDISPDLIIVAAYGQILPEDIISMPKYGCINIHASLLPKYRGASPIQTAILNGDKETGVTIMKMDSGLDTGDIIAQEKIKIKSDDATQTLRDKLSKLGAKLLIETLPDYLSGKIKPFAQDNSKAVITKILTKKDGEIDFNESASSIERKLRAFTPWPGIYAFFNNSAAVRWRETAVERETLPLPPPRKVDQLKPYPYLRGRGGAAGRKLKILKLKIEEQTNPLMLIGRFYEAENKLMVNCGNGALILEKVQLEGKQEIGGREFINGYLK